eukprot:scaffold99568_cov66-Phaeocystis_antarctica.AAC.1
MAAAAARAQPSSTTSRAHECCLALVRPRHRAARTSQPAAPRPTPRPHLASAYRLVWSLSPAHQFLLPTSAADTSLARPCPLPQHHARPPRPGTRLTSHPSPTRPCVRRPPDVSAFERDQDKQQAHQVDPRQAGAQNSHRAHSPSGRAPRARMTTRSPTV